MPVKVSDLITNIRTRDITVDSPHTQSQVRHTREGTELIPNTRSAHSPSLAVAAEGTRHKCNQALHAVNLGGCLYYRTCFNCNLGFHGDATVSSRKL